MEKQDDVATAIRESKYNSGIDKIYTMSTIRKGCHDFKIEQNFSSWFQCLRSWRSEMNSKFDEDEKKKCEQYHKFFDAIFHKKLTIKLDDGKVVDVSNISDLEIDNALYDYELYLGDLAEKYHMGMPDAEDDEGL